MTTTEYLNLALSGTSDEDLDQTFLEWRQKINGENCGSNMELIDAAIKLIMQTLASTIKTVNGVSANASGDIALTASSVHARPDTWTPTAEEVGARPITWTPTPADIGAATQNHSHNGLSMIDQDVKTTASPTFNEVTATTVRADTVIGAVYA